MSIPSNFRPVAFEHPRRAANFSSGGTSFPYRTEDCVQPLRVPAHPVAKLGFESPNRRNSATRRQLRISHRDFGSVLSAVLFFAVSGCGYSGGQILYGLGFGKTQEVKAEFRLTPNPVLILLDDDAACLNVPSAKRTLVDELAQELLRHGAAQRIIPPETVDTLRQQHPNFDKRGCREVGEMAGAEQVLWIQLQGYFADEQFVDATEAAYVQATVKVINVLEREQRSRVRLWPVSSEGTAVAVSLPGDKVARLQTTDAIAQELAKELAAEIARFFYDRRLGDLEAAPPR